jgi:pentatricopeptide repeat protein
MPISNLPSHRRRTRHERQISMIFYWSLFFWMPSSPAESYPLHQPSIHGAKSVRRHKPCLPFGSCSSSMLSPLRQSQRHSPLSSSSKGEITTRIYLSSTSLRQSENTQQAQTSSSSSESLNSKQLKQLERQIVQLGRQGYTDQALAVYHKIPRESRTVRLMNGAIDACARARPTRLQQAFELFEQETTEPSSEECGAIVPNVFTFGALMSACARARRGDRARELLKTMQVRIVVIMIR